MNEAELIAVGGDAALTFVNSAAAPGRKPMELISDGPAYLAFLEQAGMLDAADRDAVARQFDRAELDAAATEATRLRGWLRPQAPLVRHVRVRQPGEGARPPRT